jgi:CheY-like chemotaxis protein
VTIKRFPHKTTSRYLLKYSIVRFFLLAMSSGESSLADDSARINKIREQQYKILVIDDDDDFRKSFCFKLKRKYKAQVEDAVSGEAGIEKLIKGNSYDFIFTDIMMPGMTGIEAYHKLREIDDQIPIVIMSAYSDSNEWKKAQDLNVPLLHKPISEDQLIKTLGA